jgi:hypothetical protein
MRQTGTRRVGLWREGRAERAVADRRGPPSLQEPDPRGFPKDFPVVGCFRSKLLVAR